MTEQSNSAHPPHRLITVTGEDRPGLIAAVAGALAAAGADIEDVSMTRLMGNFAMMLVARGGDAATLRSGLDSVQRDKSLHIHLEPSVEPKPMPRANAYISVAGPNRVGILAAVAGVLAEHGANIVELTTRLLERTGIPIYMIRLEAVAPDDGGALESGLREVAKGLGVEVRLEPIDPGEM